MSRLINKYPNLLRILTLFLLTTFFQINVWAQLSEFEKANNLYANGKYKEAVEIYQSIEKQNAVSFELFYNIGNCYYRLNDIANCILYYEKAKKVDPLNTELLQNLKLANLKTTDRIEYKEPMFFEKISLQIIKFFTPNSWAVLSLILLFMACGLFVLQSKTSSKSKQKMLLGSLILLILFLVSFLLSWQAKKTESRDDLAIVFSNTLNCYSEPNNSSALLFTIHEGTLVEVKSTDGDWINVKLATGVTGWAPKLSVKKI